jgi:hypothetical protein
MTKQKQEKIKYCKCGGKIALCEAFCSSVQKDQEPYQNGVITGNQEDIELNGSIMLKVRICEKCKKIKSAEVDY